MRSPRYLVGNGRGRPSKKKIEVLYFGPAGSLTKTIATTKPELFECPLCDEFSGSIGTEDELRDHLLEDHFYEDSKEGFIREVLSAFLCEYAFVRGLLHK